MPNNRSIFSSLLFVLTIIFTNSSFAELVNYESVGDIAYGSGEYHKAYKSWTTDKSYHNSASVNYKLAYLTSKGLGTKKDEYKAYQLYTDAANAGHAKASYELAQIYFQGIGIAVEPNQHYTLGMPWLIKSAEGGYSIAMHQLAKLYYAGTRIKFDERKSNVWLAKAALLENSDAQYDLASRYQRSATKENGNGEEAIKWFYKSMENGCIKKCYSSIGAIYEFGSIVEQDLSKALYYYKKIAEIRSRNIEIQKAKERDIARVENKIAEKKQLAASKY